MKTHTDTPEIIRAARILTMQPGRPVLLGGALLVADGRIVDLGTFSHLRTHYHVPVRDLGDVTMLPGLVNAHVHLEMSHLRGRMARCRSFPEWLRQLIHLPMYETDEGRMRDAVAEMAAVGVAGVGDISTRNHGRTAQVLDGQGMGFTVFAEAISFTPPDRRHAFIPKEPTGGFRGGRFSAAGHAFYSTAPETLQRAKAACEARRLPFSLHLAECPEEVEMLTTGGGALRDVLAEAGLAPPEDWRPPYRRPVEYADSLGLLGPRTLAVHCVQIDQGDAEILASTGASVALCPRSNEFIGVGCAPWDKLFKSRVRCCLATDGVVSNDDLDPWKEAALLKQRYDGPLSMAAVTAMLTRNPARALGLGEELGCLAPGRPARWAVAPAYIEDLFR